MPLSSLLIGELKQIAIDIRAGQIYTALDGFVDFLRYANILR